MKIEKLRLKALKIAAEQTEHNWSETIKLAEDYLTFLQFGLNPKNNIVNYPPQYLTGYDPYLTNMKDAGTLYITPSITSTNQ